MLFAMSIFAQNPSVTGIAFNPSVPEENGSGTSSFLFQLLSGVDIPLSQELKVTISLTNVAFSGPPTGAGAALFDWVPLGTIGYQGTQNAVLSPFINLPINFSYDVTGAMGDNAVMVAQLSNTAGLDMNNTMDDFTTVNADILVDPLPVELISFSGKINDCETIDLNWKTETENNNKGFYIQKLDQNNRFENIDFVEGLGNSIIEKDYSFSLPLETNLYGKMQMFRLQQEDFDGTISFSDVIALANNCRVDIDLMIYPNPAIDQINVVMKSDQNKPEEVELFNEFQQYIKTITINPFENNNVEIGDLAPGVYFLRIAMDNEYLVKRFVKVKE